MLFLPLLSFFALTASTASAAIRRSDLVLPHIFSIELQVATDANLIAYPYGGGQRLNVAFVGGSLSTPANGTVATLVPGLGGEQGIIREDGVVLVDARIVFQFDQAFDPSQRFAFLQLRGKSVATDSGTKGQNYLEFETNSPAFAYLNTYFLAGQLSRDGVTLLADFFGEDPSNI